MELLGLDDPTLAVYRRLLRHPEDVPEPDPTPEVRAALERLVSAGLVRRRVDTGGHVAERPDAADEPEEFFGRLSDVLRFELAALMQRDSATVTADRTARYRALGR